MEKTMIQHIRTVGFKGFDIDEDVPKKAIYTGRNKSGKSTRAGAIALALYGHIPFSTAGKRPGDIMDSFGRHDILVVAVTIGGTEFARKFSRNSKGGVAQSVQVDKKKTSAENFAILLDRAGAPRIADVAEFMKQSDTKKTDTLFDLFPNDALSSIDTEIENAKQDVSRLEKKKIGAESTVVRLTHSKQAFEIPSGNIAEVQVEINKVEIQIVELSEQIKQAEIEEAKVKKENELKDQAGETRCEMLKNIGVDLDFPTCREMEESAWVEFFNKKSSEYHAEKNRLFVLEQKEKERAEKEALEKPDGMSESEIAKCEQLVEDFEGRNEQNLKEGRKVQIKDFKGSHGLKDPFIEKPYGSILRIIDALKGAGCGTCAALIIAKQELKKYKEVS